VLGWELAGVMEHQIVASGREGGNRRKCDPCPVIRDLWKRERQGRLRGGLMLVAVDFILSLGETGGAPPRVVVRKECANAWKERS
jgi:hypothetical protein